MKKQKDSKKLTNITEVKIRFSEVDSIHVVWHGNYVRYMEDGRENFGEEFGLQYLYMFENGYTAPIVDVKMQYKQSVSVGESVIVETTYRPTRSAKLIFDYVIYRKSDHSVVLTAETTQVFMGTDGELQLNNPPFFQQWKEKWGL